MDDLAFANASKQLPASDRAPVSDQAPAADRASAAGRAPAADRPVFPKRAVVTAGMPYGNKELHFGHVGGYFVQTDIYARFLRDRLGSENVIFVSGTDCYGSTIEIDWQKARDEKGYTGSITDFVAMNHARQKETLDLFGIEPDLYAASALGRAGEIHRQVSADVFEKLYASGYLQLRKARQFYDPKAGVFLNGRQVTGYCPIAGCKSEVAYANECALGHQFNEADLKAPRSQLSDARPELREVENWYFDLEAFRGLLMERSERLAAREEIRPATIAILNEFLKEPVIYLKNELLEQVQALGGRMPAYTLEDDPKKSSVSLVFTRLDDREAACAVLDEAGIRYRTGKTLVPFRLSGNVAWGIPVPEKDGVSGYTFWVWPESLWAPISFTRALLEQRNGTDAGWEDWWHSSDCRIYQFIGEDNLYFYGLAEMALFMALRGGEPTIENPDGQLQLPDIIADRHILYQGGKASSSGQVKPPMANELLSRYTAEQLRFHFFSLNLAVANINFQPQAFLEPESKRFDPTLKEGNLLTNTFNRLIRSCFYTNQKYFGSHLPVGVVGDETRERCDQAIVDFERAMWRTDFSRATEIIELLIHDMSKNWAAGIKAADQDEAAVRQVLIDSFHAVRVLAALVHPIAPDGCAMIRDYLNLDDSLWDWERIFADLGELTDHRTDHELRFLEPRVDFFRKHDCQLKG